MHEILLFSSHVTEEKEAQMDQARSHIAGKKIWLNKSISLDYITITQTTYAKPVIQSSFRIFLVTLETFSTYPVMKVPVVLEHEWI